MDELRVMIRNYDWSSTPLGPMSSWSQGLKTGVSMMLNCRFPSILFWGDEFVQVCKQADSLI